jgi:hypothetical protein
MTTVTCGLEPGLLMVRIVSTLTIRRMTAIELRRQIISLLMANLAIQDVSKPY